MTNVCAKLYFNYLSVKHVSDQQYSSQQTILQFLLKVSFAILNQLTFEDHQVSNL